MFGAQVCPQATLQALLSLGARGYSQALPLEQRFWDALGLKLGDGTQEIMKLIISREYL